ncbi:hypothetical protein, conserved [Eimeria maxima]|uniref:Uncharacterized protein n=1 Tax=Eimeria maxima TaxID=5804 RepID=U6MBX9_EIMMA|nr:hypothetical protein, conserved [Eimeria maxima]CDJ60548.1 hypothetical protein, conserved [Eimeria maxima]
MEVYWRDAGRTLLDWWRPKQEAGNEVHPASQDNAENTDETVQEDGTLGKLDGRRVGVTPPLLATISLILLSGVLFLVSRKRQFALSDSPKLSSPTLSFPELSATELSTPELTSPELTSPELSPPELGATELSPPELGATELSPPELASPELSPPETNSPELSPPEMTSSELSAPELSPPELTPAELSAHMLGSPELSSPNLSSHNERTPLPVSDDIIRRSLEDLEEERRAMNDTWFSSGDSIKEAFQKYFMPPLDDGQSSTRDPLTTIKDHVSKMQKCEFPSNSSEKVRKGFLQQVQLLHSICRLVTLRLRELKWIEETGGRHLSYRPFFEHEGSYSNFYSEDSRSAPAFEDPDSNSGGENHGIPSLYGAEELLVSMGMFGFPRRQEVDEAVAYELIFQLVIEKRINIGNLEARHLGMRLVLLQPKQMTAIMALTDSVKFVLS